GLTHRPGALVSTFTRGWAGCSGVTEASRLGVRSRIGYGNPRLAPGRLPVVPRAATGRRPLRPDCDRRDREAPPRTPSAPCPGRPRSGTLCPSLRCAPPRAPSAPVLVAVPPPPPAAAPDGSRQVRPPP